MNANRLTYNTLSLSASSHITHFLQEVLLEMFSDEMSEDDSQANLIKGAARDTAPPLNQDIGGLLESALDNEKSYI